MESNVINNMEVDDLRNLVTHLYEVDEARSELSYAQRELIDHFQRIYSTQVYKDDVRAKVDNKLRDLRELENHMKEKYSEFLPKPVAGVSEAE